MATSTLEQELLNQLSQMGAEQRQRVLDFARALATAEPKGVPGQELLSFAGTIDPDDLQIMAQAIVEDCETVDLNDW